MTLVPRACASDGSGGAATRCDWTVSRNLGSRRDEEKLDEA